MRLDKLLSHTGFGSRKEVKPLLKSGAVVVNGTIQKDSKTQVNPDKDQITVHGTPVVYQEFVYFMLHKPQNVVSATEDNVSETVIDLLAQEDTLTDPFPVGRLDKDTEGLLIITNDGTLAHNLLSPKKHIDKTYYAKIDGDVTAEDVEAFAAGIELDDGYTCKPARLEIITPNEIKVTIQEGKFHQVKRMFAARGKSVSYLKRISMGNLQLDESLALGEYRPLTEAELAILQNK
ncbi:rRNA pseudouridine synthase [Listeria monocytogenes]|mgnify:CR=1 FL=1|jgi:ribosomal small subunit pseudouridine synthase A (EC 5.4.99.-)|uniref:Pseudouridine synthase n=3 Tax=Listeria monocytogenes TaxID=1639 RepID=Q8Y4U0_LISMO|nr:pseudouridine synthase [Listeria monocytogenes]NP_465865.1 16S pseudouridylate synthase [Listeria monocytogenes EGD-e]EAD5036440.1 rRNA pseudouridine synthase [Listeria monocytogenes serotype 1/2a]EAE3702119.1 rRNA pseudouridine synthase [Listeria monocytogenes serotype 1/2c]EAF4574312.1 rRNA pseudouridine synthase [Listeria monocytogenes serotype 4b]AEO26684.1 ribosomal small subunit pseudouridine synthase A [Listeria monocytogenes FSL R2-561]ALU80681.1 16S rRNA pseudouridine(516) synthas